jgi:hypothetical protein
MTLPRAPASWLTNTVPGPPDVVLDPQNVILGLDPRIGSRVHIARLLAFLGVSGDPRVEPEDDGFVEPEDDGKDGVTPPKGIAHT